MSEQNEQQKEQVEVEEEQEKIHPFDRMFFGDRSRQRVEQPVEENQEDNQDNTDSEGSIMDNFFGGLFKKKI